MLQFNYYLSLCLLPISMALIKTNHFQQSSIQSTTKLYSIQHQIAVASMMAGMSFSPVGNIGAALSAVLKNPESLSCVLDTQQADADHGTCQQLDSIVRYRVGKLLTIKQDWGGSSSTGAAVWNGANMMGWYLENTEGADKLKGKRVIELGAGVGLGGLIAHYLGAGEVVLTDGNEDVLKLANENIKLNVEPERRDVVESSSSISSSTSPVIQSVSSVSTSTSTSTSVPKSSKPKSSKTSLSEKSTYKLLSSIYPIQTARLRWGSEDEEKFSNTNWDYIIASDVTYRKEAWPILMNTIAHLANKQTVILLSMEPRNVGEIDGVLDEAVAHGMQWKEEILPIDKEKEKCSLLCARLFKLRVHPRKPFHEASHLIPMVEI